MLEDDELRTYTTCGTPEYMAPELVLHQSHGFAVDWWCVGIFTYECLTGKDPFSSGGPSDSLNGLYRRITDGEYEWPKIRKVHPTISAKTYTLAKRFTDACLHINPAGRLGGKLVDADAADDPDDGPAIMSVPEKVKQHAIFAAETTPALEFFAALMAKNITPPVVPQPSSKKPIKSREFEQKNPLDKPDDDDDEDCRPPQSEIDEIRNNWAHFSSAWATPWRPRPGEDVESDYTTEHLPKDVEDMGGKASAEKKARQEKPGATSKALSELRGSAVWQSSPARHDAVRPPHSIDLMSLESPSRSLLRSPQPSLSFISLPIPLSVAFSAPFFALFHTISARVPVVTELHC